MHFTRQAREIDAAQVAAVIVNVVLAPLLAVGRNIDAAVELVANGFGGGAPQQRFRYFRGIVLGITEITCGTVVVGTGLGPVTDRDVVWLGVSADAGS